MKSIRQRNTECPPGALRVKPGKKHLANLFIKAKKENKKFIYFENGIHEENGQMIAVDFSVTIIGASRDRCIFKGGFDIEGEEDVNVAITNLTIRKSKKFGVIGGGASFQLNKVTVDLCECGILVSRTQRNTMTDCQISHSKGSGLLVVDGGLMTIDGDVTAIHDNCTDGRSNNYGLNTCFFSSIHLASSLTIETISKNNGGGGNHGGEGTIFYTIWCCIVLSGRSCIVVLLRMSEKWNGKW